MPTERRFVFDTNVLISAALVRDSIPRTALDQAVRVGSLLVSADTLAELAEVLGRPKFDKFLPHTIRSEFVRALIDCAELIEIGVQINCCRDPKDDKILELAVNGRASHIVSGDQDLLVLHPFRGISICSPKAFIQELHAQS